MARHVGTVGVKAWGVSNTLKSKLGGGFARSERLNPKDRKNTKVSAGFRVDQIDEGTVHIHHVLGDRHGITAAADRIEVIEKHLDSYTESLASRFKITRAGSGENQYLTVTEHPNPIVAQTLMDAAARLEKLGDHRTAALLISWADKDGKGESW